MKFSVLHTAGAQYQFAVTTDGVHRSVEGLPTLTEAMHLTLAELKTRTAGATTTITGELAPPIAAEIELWGAGVTYLRSRDARKEESGVPDVYQRIYINKHREIIGYAICNDVTARSIEGENPLYLSQAKIYIGSTAIGPDITPAWLAPAANEMSIKAKILRGSALIWEAETSLGALNRTLEDLVNYVFRCQDFPHGLILSTGTGIVPPMDIALAAGDIVEINVAGVGTLSNTVEVIPER